MPVHGVISRPAGVQRPRPRQVGLGEDLPAWPGLRNAGLSNVVRRVRGFILDAPVTGEASSKRTSSVTGSAAVCSAASSLIPSHPRRANLRWT